MNSETSGFRRGKFHATMEDMKTKKEIDAFVKDDMAVHRSLGNGKSWVVSHIPTGCKIDDFPTLKGAKKFAIGFMSLGIPESVLAIGKKAEKDRKKYAPIVRQLAQECC